VKLIGAALGDEIDDGAAGMSILSRVVAAEDGYFAKAIAQGRRKELAGDGVVVVVGAVN